MPQRSHNMDSGTTCCNGAPGIPRSHRNADNGYISWNKNHTRNIEIYQTMDNNISTRTSSTKIKIKMIEEWGKFMKCIFVTTMDKFNILPFFCLIFFLYFFVALHLVVFFLRISQPTFYRTILNFQLYILTCKRQPLLSANPTRQIFWMCLNILWDWRLKG